MFAQRFDENYKFKPFLMKYKDTMDSIAKGMVLNLFSSCISQKFHFITCLPI